MKSDSDRPLILITGAAQRVGRALALHFAREGWRVAGHFHSSRTEADALMRDVARFEGEIELYQADLSDEHAAANLAMRVQNTQGAPDALINNAALFLYDRIGAFDPKLLTTLISVNLQAAIELTEAVIALRRRQLSVLNILDQKIRNLTAQNFSYSLSKSAFAAATRMHEIGLSDACGATVRVNAIGPGLMLRSGRQTDAEFERMAIENPLSHAPALSEICAWAQFLIETDSISGQTIYVDGGLHLLGGERRI